MFAATYSTEKETFGQITSIFEVEEGWTGYRHHGYCRPTEDEVLEFFEQDLSLVRGAAGIYGPGTPIADAHRRLSENGFTVNFRLDGGPLIYFNGRAC